MKIYCLGDSLTEGDYGVYQMVGIPNIQKENYPYYLSLLSGNPVVNFGKCAANSSTYYSMYKSGVYEGIRYPNSPEKFDLHDADIIIIMLGTNGGLSSKENTCGNNDYRALISACQNDAKSAHIVLCTPPNATIDPSKSNCGYSNNVIEAGIFVRNLAKELNLPLIDFADCEILSPRNENVMQPNDGLHFSDIGYFEIAYYIYTHLCKQFPDFAKGISKDYTINLVGDSVTWGLNYCDPDETYCGALAKKLSYIFPKSKVHRYDGLVLNENEPISKFEGPIIVNDGSSGEISVIRNGVGGDTVARAFKRIDDFTHEMPNGKSSDITVCMFGINDCIKSVPDKYLEPDVFRRTYENLIDEISKRDPETTIVLMTPTYDGTQSSLLDEYSNIVMDIAKEKNLALVDQHKLWLAHYNESDINNGQGDWLSDVSWDFAHPTAKGAEIIADNLLKTLITLI